VKCTSTKSAYFKLNCDGEIYYSFDEDDDMNNSYTFVDCKNPSKAQCYVGDRASKNTERYTDDDKCVIEPYCDREENRDNPICILQPDCSKVNE
jgi:hypothetical protein